MQQRSAGFPPGLRSVDAGRFVSFAQRLHATRERIAGAPADDARRANWKRLLAAVADAAQTSLDVAEAKLTRLDAEIHRALRR